MNYVTENITPAKAQEYLQTSIGNRPISNVFVRSYSDTMKKGNWILNGVPIIFDNDGHLLDGHHRLLAVIDAGIPVRFDVSRGASTEAFSTYDCGRHRTVGQLLAMQGIKNYNLVGSIVSANEQLVIHGRLVANNGQRGISKSTNAEKYDLYRKDPEGFDDVAQIICGFVSRCRILSGSWAGGLYYYLTHTGGYTKEEVHPFFDGLFSLDTSDIQPADTLRKYISRRTMEGVKIKAELLWVYIVKAWNAYITGKELKHLRFYRSDEKQEEIPKLILR